MKNWIQIFLAFSLFTGMSLHFMISTPLHDFDGANRAEGAKQMVLNKDFLVPLTGSPYLRNEELRIVISNNPLRYLYYHLERPPLVFWLMGLSTSLFGEKEVFYRLPSFIFALGIFFIFLFFVHKLDSKVNHIALITAFVALITSHDIWLSGQMSLLDTTLTFFMFSTFCYIVLLLKTKKNIYAVLGGIAMTGAFLGKGPPTAILLMPIMFLVGTRKISYKSVLYLILTSALFAAPWIILTIVRFGLNNFLDTFVFTFAQSRFSRPDATQKAPIYWYARWWLDTLRPGFLLFIFAGILDIVKRKFDPFKLTLATYIGGGFMLYSLASNNVWWYVLPLIPPICMYIYFSLKRHLELQHLSVAQLSFIIILFSLPIFREARTTITFLYAIVMIVLALIIYKFGKKFNKVPYLFSLSLTVCLISFILHFPRIQPTYLEAKPVALHYKSLPEPKCLYVSTMPYESILFYSNAGEIKYWDYNTKLSKDCTSYLITPNNVTPYKSIFNKGRLHMYVLK